ncbi:hypothetical protein EDD15DRAFT_2358911 [Pisolithus albus]|nr:hypothetical protein EDD15DRAFT_2358911 [Pisolithus albus]
MNLAVADWTSSYPFSEDHNAVLASNSCFSTETLHNSQTFLGLDSQRSSCSSTKPSPTVRFAPLPKTDSSRKRSIPPLGVSGRARLLHEGRKPLWSIDPSSGEIGEDPMIALGNFVKKAGMKMLQRVKKKSTLQEKDNSRAVDVIDIKPDEISGETEHAVSSQETGGYSGGRRRRKATGKSVVVN